MISEITNDNLHVTCNHLTILKGIISIGPCTAVTQCEELANRLDASPLGPELYMDVCANL